MYVQKSIPQYLSAKCMQERWKNWDSTGEQERTNKNECRFALRRARLSDITDIYLIYVQKSIPQHLSAKYMQERWKN
jgi:hypothetical protein